jgi:hypothetical protein
MINPFVILLCILMFCASILELIRGNLPLTLYWFSGCCINLAVLSGAF